jgi:hypothetical protein
MFGRQWQDRVRRERTRASLSDMQNFKPPTIVLYEGRLVRRLAGRSLVFRIGGLIWIKAAKQIGLYSQSGESPLAVFCRFHPRIASRFLVADEINYDTLGHCRGKLQSIPVGQSNTAVRFRLADFRRIRGAVDSIALGGQPYPNNTNRIVRPGLNCEWFLGAHASESIVGVIAISRIFTHSHDL